MAKCLFSFTVFFSEAAKSQKSNTKTVHYGPVLIQGANAHLNAYRLNVMIMKNQEWETQVLKWSQRNVDK